MPGSRVRIDTDKVNILKVLAGEKGVFPTYADTLAFAASLAASKGLRREIQRPAKDPDPIRIDVFQNKGYDALINLLAFSSENSPAALGRSPSAEDRCVDVFEQYANAGLELLSERLKGEQDHLFAVLLILEQLDPRKLEEGSEIPDLTKLLADR